MKLFCFSDIHQRPPPECDPAPDAWLFAGDLYDRPDRRRLTDADVRFGKTVREWMESHPQPVYAVRGNHDTDDKTGFFNSCVDISEGGIRKLGDGLYVAGIGWAGDRYYDLPTENDIKERCASIENMASLFEGRYILLTHYPPHDPAIFPWMLDFQGYYFKCLAELIQKLKPIIVIAGHVHDQFGKIAQTHGATIIFPGPIGKVLNVGGTGVSVEN